jgi:hypothetical protein
MASSIPAPKPLDIDRAKVAAITCKSTKDFCEFLELDPISFKHWCNKYPEYERAVMSWRTYATSEIEVALAKRAVGFTKQTKRDIMDKNGQIHTLINETYYPPSETAAQFWLKNRAPNDWQDKKEIDVNLNANIRAWLVQASGSLDPTEILDVSPDSLIANELANVIEPLITDNEQANLEAALIADLMNEVEAEASAPDPQSSSENVSPQNPADLPGGGWSNLNSKWS